MSTGLIGRIRSRQAGHPSGLLGRFVGRAMVKDTAAANDRALTLLDLRAPLDVLEVGFGQGRTVERLLDDGHTVFGVDVSDTMVRQATARIRDACRDGRATLRPGDGVAIPFADDSVDAAITVHTVYFMADVKTTVAEVARVLRPGGRFVIACRVGDDGLEAWMDPSVYRIPTKEQITTMLTVAGFDQVTDHVGRSHASPCHWFVADLPVAVT